MTSIITYKCDHSQCKMNVSLRINFPIWKEDTPEEAMMLPISKEAEKHILEYKQERLCTNCSDKVLVENNTYICPKCYQGDTFLNVEDICYMCKNGKIIEDKDMRVQF